MDDANARWVTAWVECVICLAYHVAVYPEGADEETLECHKCGACCSRVLCVAEVEHRTGRDYETGKPL